jgi:sterol desaturase/sphingolipid hydroxylase (fatty acid hydroxylase superfamily)
LLSAFASDEQDWCDILVIPLLTYMVFPLNFSTWFVAQQMIIYTESMGHSGIRVVFETPMTGYILRYLGMELCLEDHDLHHRAGWRNSSNYGKQTRVWDRLFGSTRPRIEGVEGNIDWVNTAQTG